MPYRLMATRACSCKLLTMLGLLAVVLSACATHGTPPSHTGRVSDSDAQPVVRFAIVSDRTGGHRPGVFETAVEKVNLLAPDFVMSVGDFIEGYTTDGNEIDRQWDEFTGFIERFDAPFYYVPGNHDLSNDEMNAAWRERFGATYQAFVRDGCLFLCLNTEDPSGGHLGPEQLDYMARTLDRHADVRWTFVFMHQPLWRYKHDTGWDRMEQKLAGRPFTVFAGHMHAYLRELRDGHEYITLGTTGGGGPMRGANYGEVDHIVWVTLGDSAPHIANVEVDHIWDTGLYTADLGDSLAPALGNQPLLVEPILWPRGDFDSVKTHMRVSNPTSYPMVLEARIDSADTSLQVSPSFVQLEVAPGESLTRSITIDAVKPLPRDAVPAPAVRWRAFYDVPSRPSLEMEGTTPMLVVPESLSYDTPSLPAGASPAGIADVLFRAGQPELAVAAVNVYAPFTRSTPEALMLIQMARTIGHKEELGTRLGFVCDWYIGKPEEWHFTDGLRSQAPSNLPFDTLPTAQAWQRFLGNHDTGVVDLLRALGDRRDSSVFAATVVDAKEGSDAVLHLRSDDGIAVWLNGQQVHAKNAIRGVATEEDHVPVRLVTGDNQVVVEVTQGIEGWAFSVRITRPDGTPYPIAVR